MGGDADHTTPSVLARLVRRVLEPKLGTVLLIAGTFLFGAGTWLVAQAHMNQLDLKERTERARTEENELTEVATLTASMTPVEEDSTLAFERARADVLFPREGGPGVALQELVTLLEESGIDTYRYSVQATTSAAESRPPSGWDAIWKTAARADAGAAAKTEPAPPLQDPKEDLSAFLRTWPVELEVETTYPLLVTFLEALESEARLWRCGTVELTRNGRVALGSLRLETYTQPPVLLPDTEKLRIGMTRASDPFLDTTRNRPVPPPRLGAVRLGAVPSAWINGQYVRIGDAVQGWTVMEIDDHGVLLQTKSGQFLRLKLP